jgi:5-methylcytosine-specific restriction endonuclease McrA
MSASRKFEALVIRWVPIDRDGPALCFECGLLADSVHHILELEDGGAPRDPANLMSLCRSHHSVIHAQRRGGEGRVT